jgi:hypothetical protein
VPEKQKRRKKLWSGVELEGYRRSHPNISCVGEAAHEHRSRRTHTRAYQFEQCVLEEAEAAAKGVKQRFIPRRRLRKAR